MTDSATVTHSATSVVPPHIGSPALPMPVPDLATLGAPSPGQQPWSGNASGQPPAEESPSGRVIRVPEIPVRKLVALSLMCLGMLIVLFLVYLFAFTPLTAHRNQQRLVHSLIGQPLFRYSLTTGRVPAEGSAVAVLSIPQLHLHQVVVEGTSAADLMMGPGLMPGTSLPGSPGNAVIAGRRATFGAPFGSLDQLRPGARLVVVDGAGTFTYRVSSQRTVNSGQRDVVAPTLDNRLTLITSSSGLASGGRLALVAKLSGRPYAVPAGAVAIPTYELGLGGDPASGGLVVVWSLLTVAVLLAAALAAWRWRHPWLVYLFAAPVFVACGLFACQSLARMLPATF